MLKDRNFGQKRNSLTGQILQDYLAFNSNYQQGLTNKNLQLHCTLNKIASHNITLDNDFHILRRKSIYEKQQILRDSVQRTQELLQAKMSMNRLRQSQILQQSRSTCMTQNLKKQLSHSDVVTHQLSFRLSQMQVQMKNKLAEKDQIIEGLRKRIDIYQRQNKKLQEANRNLKVIQVQASLEKKYSSHSKSKSKLRLNSITEEKGAEQEIDLDKQRSQKMQREKIARLEKQNSRLLQQNLQSMTKIAELQRQVERGRKQVEQLRRLRQNPKQNPKFDKLKQGIKQQKEQKKLIRSWDAGPEQTQQQQAGSLETQKKTLSLYDAARGEGIIASIITLRNGINKEIFDVFIDSLKRAEKAKTNAFAQFLDAWRVLDVGRVEPYVVAYFQAIGDVNLYLEQFGSTLSIQIKKKINQTVPITLHQTQSPTLPEALQSKSPFVYKTHLRQLYKQEQLTKKRSQINQWILSTIQFTINQQKTNASNLKNSVLYLFRLLSIQYRISYPPKGQEIKYHLDTDVRYCLLHWVVDGVRHVIANL